MNWTTAPISLIPGLVLAVVTSLLTVHLALRRFYSEQWWERKSAAYTAIIESMHHLREHADTNLTFESRDVPLPKDGEQELDLNLKRAMADLRKHRDIGSFVISEEATGILNSLFQELDKSAEIGRYRSYIEYLDYRVGAVDQALAKMRDAAKKDLSIQR